MMDYPSPGRVDPIQPEISDSSVIKNVDKGLSEQRNCLKTSID